MGAASVSIRRLWAAIHEADTGPALGFDRRQGGVGLSPVGSFLDGPINLT